MKLRLEIVGASTEFDPLSHHVKEFSINHVTMPMTYRYCMLTFFFLLLGFFNFFHLCCLPFSLSSCSRRKIFKESADLGGEEVLMTNDQTNMKLQFRSLNRIRVTTINDLCVQIVIWR